MDMTIASGKFGVGVIKKLCQRVFDGKDMPEEWKTSVVVPIIKGKGDVMDCGAYRVKLLEHAMKIVETLSSLHAPVISNDEIPKMENRSRGLVTGFIRKIEHKFQDFFQT